MWKSNRRDECYDLYLDTCEEANRNLHSLELRGPLSDSIANGQQQGPFVPLILYHVGIIEVFIRLSRRYEQAARCRDPQKGPR